MKQEFVKVVRDNAILWVKTLANDSEVIRVKAVGESNYDVFSAEGEHLGTFKRQADAETAALNDLVGVSQIRELIAPQIDLEQIWQLLLRSPEVRVFSSLSALRPVRLIGLYRDAFLVRLLDEELDSVFSVWPYATVRAHFRCGRRPYLQLRLLSQTEVDALRDT